MSLDTGLIAHWPLATDARDALGVHHGDARGVQFQGGAAGFDGRAAHIEVPRHSDLQPGAGDFSIAVRIHTAEILDHVLGPIYYRLLLSGDPIDDEYLWDLIVEIAWPAGDQDNQEETP